MKGYVVAELPVPVVPEPSVTLNLSIEEFALLQAVLWLHLDGASDARHGLQAGVGEVIACLPPRWRNKVLQSRSCFDDTATGVREVFEGTR